MQKITLKISNNTINYVSVNPVFKKKDSGFTLSVVGELIGAVYENKKYNPKETFHLLCNSINNLKEVMRCVIGSCYIIHHESDTIRILCSCSSPGFFYVAHKSDFYLYSSEKDSYKNHGCKNELNDDQLIGHIMSHQILMRTPFDSLFDNIKRCPPGGRLIISDDDKTDVDVFVLKNESELKRDSMNEKSINEQVNAFTFLLENTLQLSAQYYSEKKLILSKSGGIDSAVLLAAAKRNNIQFQDVYFVPYVYNKKPKNTVAQEIAAHFGYSLSYSDFHKPDINSLKKRAQEGLGMIAGPQYLRFNHEDYQNVDKKKTCVELCGQNLDSLYSIDNFGPRSDVTGFVRWIIVLQTAWKRLLYTEVIFSNNKRLYTLIRKMMSFFGVKTEGSYKKYITSTVHSVNEHVIPFINKDTENKIPKYTYKKFNTFREDKILNEILKITKKRKLSGEIEKWDPLLKNHMVRILRWYRTIHNVTATYHNTDIYENVWRLTPFSEGPLSNFFLNYMLKPSDAFLIKRIMHKAFKDYSGHKHEYFVKKAIKKKTFYHKTVLILKLLLSGVISGKLRNYLEQKYIKTYNFLTNKPHVLQFVPELKVLQKMINTNEKFLVSLIKNESHVEYVSDLYERLEKYENYEWTRFEMMTLCRLVNIDLFLRNVFQKE